MGPHKGREKLIMAALLFRFLIGLSSTAKQDKRNQFHEEMFHGEILVFITTAIIATVAKVGSGSNL